MAEPRSGAGRLRAARRFVVAIAVAAALPVQAVVPPIAQPSWADLSPSQQQILAPLSGEWDQLEFWRRKKWLEIVERYPRLGAEEQARVQQQMKAWVRLTPEQRKAAREKYRNVQKATPEQREALKKMWSEYQALPEEERQRLQQSAANKPTPRSPAARVKQLAPRPTLTPPAAAVAAPTAPASASVSAVPAAPAAPAAAPAEPVPAPAPATPPPAAE